MANPLVALLMGSDSDLPTVKEACAVLQSFAVPFEAHVLSAHRSPEDLVAFTRKAEEAGVRVFIAAAGGAAHLAGVVAAHTTRPVIGIPIQTNGLGGLDSLLSTVQMPGGVPVATMAIGAGGPATPDCSPFRFLLLAIHPWWRNSKSTELSKPNRFAKRIKKFSQSFNAMQLAFSTNAYMRYSFAEAARRLAAIGYTGVEIMADVPHAWPAGLLDEQKQAIRHALADNHLAISNINAFMMNAISDSRQRYWHPSWIEPDRHYRQIRIDHTIRSLTLARELGARCITTEPGGPVAPGESWSAALRLFVEMLKPVIAHAEKEGVQLLIEPEPGLLIEKADQFLELMQHIDSPAVGLNFDIGHSYCVRDDPASTVPRLASCIRHFHLEDIAATRVHHHLIPGEGAIDFAATLRAIRAIGYQGWITIELYPYVDDPDMAASTARSRVMEIISQL